MGQEINELFNTPEGCDLVVENVDGRVEIMGWDRAQTQVTAVKHSDRPQVEISQDGRKVIAHTQLEHGGFMNWFKGNGAVDYTIYVPYHSNVKVKHINGPTSVAQINGHLDLHGVNGSIQVDQIDGEIQIHTVSGSVTVKALHGSANLNAVNGKLELSESVLQSLDSETVNGEIQVQATLNPEGRYRLKTVNGGCKLDVQPDLYAYVSANGINMSVNTSLPVHEMERRFGHWHATIGSGTGPRAEISFETINGSLRINNGHEIDISIAPAMPSTPPMPPTPPATPEPADFEPFTVKVESAVQPQVPRSKTEVLEMIERGEITVEEGLGFLENL